MFSAVFLYIYYCKQGNALFFSIMKKHLVLYFALWWCSVAMLYAHNEPAKQKPLSQYTHEVWTTNEGLPQNSINAITQTPNGYLWLGTQDGLARFDGVRFTVFDKLNTPQIKNNYITALHVDRSQKLWIATYDGGLICYYNNAFSTPIKVKKLENTHIRSIYEDREGGLWLAIRGHGVMRIDITRHLSFDTSNGLVHNEAWNFCQDAKGRIWIATEGGISIYDKGKFSSFTKNNGLPSNNVNVLHIAPNNKMWIGTNYGLMRVPIDLDDRNNAEIFTTAEGLPHRIVYTIFVDHNGTVWAGTREGLARLFKGEISTFTVQHGLSYAHVQSVFVDREENVWIGTDGGGLNVLRNGLFTTFTTKEGLPSNTAWTVFEDKRHQLWVGTDGGLACMDHDRSKILASYSKKDGLHDDEVYSIAEDRQGALWVATVNGVSIIEKGKVKNIEPLSLTKNIITVCVTVDSKDKAWVATIGNGILKFENYKLTDVIDEHRGLPKNYINALQEDRFGRMWVGTDGGGVSILTDTGIVTYNTANGLSNNFVHTIYHDNEHTTWIGTFGGGINRIKHGVVSSITSKQGLFNDAIFQILEDNFERLWFTSSKGIFHVGKTELNNCADGLQPTINCVSYGTEDGLKSVECNGGVQPAGWKSHNGTLWFPTAAGIATVNPRLIAVNRQPPLVVLEELIVDNQSLLPTNNVTIEPGKERLEFRFTGLSFANPKKVMFKVKLDGYDKDWYSVGNNRSVSYTHIPPGNYTFRVIAANSDGMWNEQGASFSFTRKAFFYETKMFFFIAALFVVAGLYASYRYRIRTIERRQKELEYLVEERTKDLQEAQEKTERLLAESEHQKNIAQKANEMKTQLMDMVAHDLKSPIIAISGLTREIQQQAEANQRADEYFSMIQNTSERMIKLIDDLLDISALESGELNFSMEHIDLVMLAGMTVDGFKLQAQQKGQTIVFMPPELGDVIVSADSTKIQGAMENLISNAIKYSPPNSEIRVGVERIYNKARFWIIDNGPGFSEEDKQRLFQKFQVLSAKPTGNESSTGLGLAIVKGIVEAHKGKVWVESELGKGSKFIIELDVVSSSV